MIDNIIFSRYKIHYHILLDKTVQCDAVQCALQYTRRKTLLLGTSLYKPYCSEVHNLNQHYLHILPAVTHKLDYITILWEILNLEGHQNCITGSRVTAIFLNK